MLIASFLSYQHYRIYATYVQPYVPTRTEKKLPAFWWIYTTLGWGVLSRAFSLFSGANYAVALLGDSMVTILISRSTSFRFKTRSIANNHMDHINRYQ